MIYLYKHQNIRLLRSITHELDILFLFFLEDLLNIYCFIYLLENLFINVKPVVLSPG